ncbi:MAG: TatD family hydrolase, partial [Pontiella sp.]
MLVDSHCHLDRLDFSPFDDDFSNFMKRIHDEDIEHLLCVCIDLEGFSEMRELVASYANISLTVGVHPNVRKGRDPDIAELSALAADSKIIGIGETGLDYFRSEGDLSWQHDRFRAHIRAARETNKPLIIHTRNAKDETLRIMKEERASEVGGVLHCFTEDWDMAQKAIDMNFYISFSGIVTFKNAATVQEVAKKIPEHGTRNTEHGTRNTEHGTRNTEHGTRNTEHGTRN